jgi:hypothetical protein
MLTDTTARPELVTGHCMGGELSDQGKILGRQEYNDIIIKQFDFLVNLNI